MMHDPYQTYQTFGAYAGLTNPYGISYGINPGVVGNPLAAQQLGIQGIGNPWAYAQQLQLASALAQQATQPQLTGAWQNPFITGQYYPLITAHNPFTVQQNPFIAGQQNPFITGQQNPFVTGQQNPFVTGQQNPFVTGQQNPFVTGQQNPFVTGQQNPFVTGQQNPFVTGQQNPFVTGAAQMQNPLLSQLVNPIANPVLSQLASQIGNPYQQQYQLHGLQGLGQLAPQSWVGQGYAGIPNIGAQLGYGQIGQTGLGQLGQVGYGQQVNPVLLQLAARALQGGWGI
jgi:hypothetical protein